MWTLVPTIVLLTWRKTKPSWLLFGSLTREIMTLVDGERTESPSHGVEIVICGRSTYWLPLKNIGMKSATAWWSKKVAGSPSVVLWPPSSETNSLSIAK